MQMRIIDLFLYKRRYLLGYGFIAVTVAILLYIAGLHIPGELRAAEIESALKSGALSLKNMSPAMVIDLPYHIIQRAIFELFGVSAFTIKLPSLIMAAFMILGIFLLLKTWFHRNTAVITTAFAATMTQFLFLSQDGTPHIAHAFLSVWLLLFATYVTRNQLFGTLWKVLACVTVAASFYTPLGVYLVIAMGITMLLHPHARYIVRRFSPSKLALAIIIGIGALVPVFYASYQDPAIARQLFGIPTDAANLLGNIKQAGTDLFGFFAPSDSAIIRPLYSLAMILIALLGIYKLVRYKYSARSYITTIWGILIFIAVLLNPQHATALFPVMIVLLALGVEMIISDWYRLFPHNPYARVVGLIPLSIIVLGVAFSGVTRYVNNYQYNGAMLEHYSVDLPLLQKTKPTGSPIPLAVSGSEVPFYTLVAQYDKRFTVIPPEAAINPASHLIVTHQAYRERAVVNDPTDIITNARASDADRFYVYGAPAK